MTRDNLAFLDSVLGPRSGLYRESKWLASDFDENVWHFEMKAPNVSGFSIDFNVKLSNETVLTDKENRRLLNTFKYWINASVHPDNTRGRGFAYADVTARNSIIKVANLIDYFLLNDKYLAISSCGLQAITEDHLKQFSDQQAKDKRIAEHVYGWTERLSEFLLGQVTGSDFEKLVKSPKCDGIDFASTSDNQLEQDNLSIPAELIPRVRYWLWENNLYRETSNGEHKYVVNTIRLSELIYGSITLRGAASAKPCPTILNLSELDGVTSSEYPRVPVTGEDDETISFTGIQNYKTALKALTLLKDEALCDEDLLLPPVEIIYAQLTYSPDNVASNRFATLPSQVVLNSVKNAIEFHLQYAEGLAFSLKNLLLKIQEKLANANEGARTSVAKLISPKEFSALLHPQMQRIGVEKWTISKEKNYFDALRSNKGLGELLRIYYGSVQIVVSALMARRQTEIVNLKTDSCLDESKRYLVFRKAKSTRLLEGRRVQVARPIDEIAVEMIEKLIEIHRLYIEIGFTNKTGHLFDLVSMQNPTKMLPVHGYHHGYAQNFDLFCDYFETPLRDGKRFYIRTHQLRRFFALSFFWGSGFGGMDTLRWFMGHTDLQHLYHYITENTPGEVLRHAKSQFLAETLNEHTELRELISDRYGTVDFTVLSTGDLEEYIDELILSGEVDLEPEFIDDDNGQSYRILVITRDKHYG
ncbi:hypothetical protein [Ferrovum sp.]|uniref:hypothetical protein n=1 Tax=Ferrovum sp. TaxID=2609467 RepID=UPI0026369AC5|nr:hypothetical protein [Ferrovum sp.]